MKKQKTKYEMIKQDLLDKIYANEYAEAQRLPGENELAELYDVSVITARRALTDLVQSGHIYRIKGKGSFVASQKDSRVVLFPSGDPARMKIIALIVLMYEMSDSSTMQIIRGAQTCLSGLGYSMIIECSNDDAASESLILDKCIENGVGGILLFSADPEQNKRKIKELQDKDIPVVLIDRIPRKLPVTSVSAYHFDGSYKITQYLIDNGHKKLLFVADDLENATENTRYQGFLAALEENGLLPDGDLSVQRVSDSPAELYEKIKRYHPTSLVCVNDKTAIKSIEYLEYLGLSVPRDVSVTGFDDTELCRFTHPSLTSVYQPFEEIGTIAAQKLIALIGGAAHSQTLLPTRLVIRESTRSISADAAQKRII